MSNLTIADVIAYVDAIKPNTRTTDEKKLWLNDIDTMVFEDVYCKYEDSEITEFDGYHIDTPESTPLLIPAQYGRNIYAYYLMMQIDFINNEINKYNTNASMYQSSYDGYVRYYHQTHMPIQANSVGYTGGGSSGSGTPTKTYTKEQIDEMISNLNKKIKELDEQGVPIEVIEQAISTIPKFNIAVVDELPTEKISNTTIYLLKNDSEQEPNLYSEYIYVNDKWEKLGGQTVDLTNYVKNTDYASNEKAGVIKLNAGLYIDMFGNVAVDSFNPQTVDMFTNFFVSTGTLKKYVSSKKSTTVNEESTDDTFPTSKAVYLELQKKQNTLTETDKQEIAELAKYDDTQIKQDVADIKTELLGVSDLSSDVEELSTDIEDVVNAIGEVIG